MAVDQSLAPRMESFMGVIERVAGTIVESGIPVDVSNVHQVVSSMIEREAPLATPDIHQHVVDVLLGMGPLERLLRLPDVTDVFVNGPSEIWIDRGNDLERSEMCFDDEGAIRAAVERCITPLGLRLDRSSPIVDARLPDGSRLHAAIPPASPDGPVVAIRRFTQAVTTPDELIKSGVATSVQLSALQAMVDDRVNLIVAGATGAGKTTLLNVIGSMIDPAQRVVTVEDAAELQMPGHVVRLEAQPANAEGAGRVTLTQLVRSALRMRPDRIIVGEVRGPEALDLVDAMNTGHSGSMSTIHANSLDQALWRLESLAMSGERRVSSTAVRRQIRSAISHGVHVNRTGSVRRITHVGEIA